MTEQKKPKNMTLGEIVEAMIYITIDNDRSLRVLDGKGSPYHSEAEIEKGIIDRYHTTMNPLTEELAKREQLYSKK